MYIKITILIFNTVILKEKKTKRPMVLIAHLSIVQPCKGFIDMHLIISVLLYVFFDNDAWIVKYKNCTLLVLLCLVVYIDDGYVIGLINTHSLVCYEEDMPIVMADFCLGR